MTAAAPLEIGVLADDLTGALASAARLRQRGLRPMLSWGAAPLPATGNALVVDMRTRDSRLDPAGEACAWARRLRERGCRRYELRIDSTLRGAPSSELAGLLRGAELDDATIVAVPAFPEAGRITVDGRQRLVAVGGHGPGGDDDDPTGPQPGRSRPAPLARPDVGAVVFGPEAFERIGLERVREGGAAVAASLAAAAAAGARRFVIDAIDQSHLGVAAVAVERLAERGGPVVTLSPGAWLSFYPRAHSDGFVLVLVGSASDANRRQLGELERIRGGELTMLPLDRARTLSADSLRAVASDRATVVIETTAGDPTRSGDGLSAEVAVVARRMLDAAEEGSHGCRGVVATGGHTAARLIDALESDSLAIESEPEPLCSRSTLVGGPFAGLTLLAKGGAVGGPQTLNVLVSEIEGERG